MHNSKILIDEVVKDFSIVSMHALTICTYTANIPSHLHKICTLQCSIQNSDCEFDHVCGSDHSWGAHVVDFYSDIKHFRRDLLMKTIRSK